MIGPDGTCPICGLTGCYREACAEEHGIREGYRLQRENEERRLQVIYDETAPFAEADYDAVRRRARESRLPGVTLMCSTGYDRKLPTSLETAGRDLAREALAHQGAEGQPEDTADGRLERAAATYPRTFLETRRDPR